MATGLEFNGTNVERLSFNDRHVYKLNIDGIDTWTANFVERTAGSITFQTTYDEFQITLVGYVSGDAIALYGATGSLTTATNQITLTGTQTGEAPVIITWDPARTNMKVFFDQTRPAIREVTLDATHFSALDYMCEGQTNLTGADIYNAVDVTTTSQMFSGCTNMTYISLADTTSLSDVSGMFQNCSSLSLLSFGAFDASAVVNAQYIFSGCTSITQMIGFSLPNVQDMSYALQGCTALTHVGPLDSGPTLLTCNNMFDGCSALTCIEEIDTILATNTTDMFAGCTVLTSPGSANQIEIENQAIWFDDTCSDNGIIRGSVLLSTGVSWITPDHVKWVSVCQAGGGSGGEDGFGSTDGGYAGDIDSYDTAVLPGATNGYALGAGGGRGSNGTATSMFGVVSAGGSGQSYQGDGGIRTTCGGTYADGQETGSIFGRSYGGQAGAHGNGGDGDTAPSVGLTGGGGENRTGGNGAIKISWG